MYENLKHALTNTCVASCVVARLHRSQACGAPHASSAPLEQHAAAGPISDCVCVSRCSCKGIRKGVRNGVRNGVQTGVRTYK